jgi:hypothetical protein
MLHKDVTIDLLESSNQSEYVFFDSPWLSIVKTFTMFSGELEFSNYPVDQVN